MQPDTQRSPDALAARFATVRARSVALAAPLSDADASVQSMPDASPAKWHLAHITWFFETFVLRDHVAGYRAFDDRFAYLFNSYYEAEGDRHPRDRRGLLTRPDLATILAYRAHVDAALRDAMPGLAADVRALIELGTHHEEQHQELLLTDILSLFAENPLAPVYAVDAPIAPALGAATGWIDHPGGIASIGAAGGGFTFDCEGPAHRLLLQPFRLADRLVTNAEWAAFIADGGYATAALWLSDGWAWVRRDGVTAPLYWRDDGARSFTLRGEQPIDPAAPVTHVSYYEADAFATWAGARLPREGEWETIARSHPDTAQLYDSGWQWTGSAYLPYPGFRPAEGAVGEYNGKFMSGQAVLRGGSCATPPGHSRASYRNFFYPHQRWQFTGVRLAQDS